LKSTGLESGIGLWETVGMAIQAFVAKVGDLVQTPGVKGAFKVIAVQVGGEKCFYSGVQYLETGAVG
jgi:hypothetical protein